MEHWLENRLRIEDAEIESQAAATAHAPISNTNANEGEGTNGQTTLVSRSLTSEYLARVVRSKATGEDGVTSSRTPASPSASTTDILRPLIAPEVPTALLAGAMQYWRRGAKQLLL